MILDIIFVSLIIGILVVIYSIKFGNKNQQPRIIIGQRIPDPVPVANNEEVPQWVQPLSDESEEEIQEGPIDRKKQLIKQRKKREKEERARARTQFLESEKQKSQKYDQLQQEKQRQLEEKRKKEEQAYQMLAEQQKKRKQQEFNKWKDLFKVQSEGKEKQTAEQQLKKKQQQQQRFLLTLRKNKLSLLEDLSYSFKITTKQVIELIKEFEKDGKIDGIFDDRGKYMIIQAHQWESIRSYILAKGRVKKIDIMNECARIINIPENIQDLNLNTLIEQDAN